jgi:phage I-like protein
MNLNLYLPDDLGRSAKDADLPLSQLLRAAVVNELERRAAMTETLSKTTTHEVPLDDDEGRYTGRITGAEIAANERNDVRVFLTDDERVIVHDGENLKHWVVEDPVEELHAWLDDDQYVAALRALGEEPVIDL